MLLAMLCCAALLINFTYYAHVSNLCIRINHTPYTTYYTGIMLIFLPIMLCCSAQNFDVLCSILCSCRNCSIRVYSLVSKYLTW